MSRFNTLITLFFVLFVLIITNINAVLAKSLNVNLVSVDADKRVISPSSGVDDAWRYDPEFVDDEWLLCSGEPGGIGYDVDGDYNEILSLNMREYMRSSSCFVRAEFTLDENVLDEFDYLAIKIKYDDGFVAYLNGQRIASANAPDNPGPWSNASQPHEAQSFLTFEVSEYLNALKPGDNVLAVHGMNVSGSSPDFFLAFSLTGRLNYQNNFETNLPIIVINSINNQPITTSEETRASMGVIAQPVGENKLTSSYNDFSGDILIKKEQSDYDSKKASYLFSIDGNQDASIVGTTPATLWRLGASYSDKTLLRDVIMGTIAHKMGRLENAPRLCHLFIDDEYRGIYVLKEERSRHINRINISENNSDDVSGGYILKLSGNLDGPGVQSKYPTFYTSDYYTKYEYSYPDAEAITSEQSTYITGFLHEFETGVRNNELDSVYQNYIDLASFADYFILNELSKNMNAYRNKTLFYKDRDDKNGLLYIEPDFDFEHTLSNINFYDGYLVNGWVYDFLINDSDARADTLTPPFWWDVIRNDATFKSQVSFRWNSLYNSLFSEDALVSTLDSLYSVLDDERELNFDIWSIIGMPIEPNHYVGESFDEDFDYLYLWLIDRSSWMNDVIATYPTKVNKNDKVVIDFELEQNYPNPFNPSTRIRYNLAKDDFVTLSVYNVRGELVASLVHARQLAGDYSIDWNASGLPGGLYFYKLNTENSGHVTKRMILLQ